MRFLVDAPLAPALTKWLVSNGHQAEHAADVGLLDASDSSIWDAAVERTAVLVTKDEGLAIRRSLLDGGPPIVWIRWGNTRTVSPLGPLESTLTTIVSALMRGEAVIEVT